MDTIDWKKELKLCSLDTSRSYMIENYVFHSKLWKGQKQLLQCIPNRHVTLSVKSRVVGYSCLMAAFTACEMVLNCDNDEHDIVYICHSGIEKRIFLQNVLKYIQTIPKQLWTTEYNCLLNNKCLNLGHSRLIVTSPGSSGLLAANSKKPKYVIYDEMVTNKDNFDFNNPFEIIWHDISEKIIIGGCANHRNEMFYKFVKEYKQKYGWFVKMKWLDNPYHTRFDYMYKKTHCDDIYSFTDEYDCEVFKLVKETV